MGVLGLEHGSSRGATSALNVRAVSPAYASSLFMGSGRVTYPQSQLLTTASPLLCFLSQPTTPSYYFFPDSLPVKFCQALFYLFFSFSKVLFMQLDSFLFHISISVSLIKLKALYTPVKFPVLLLSLADIYHLLLGRNYSFCFFVMNVI